MTPNIDRVTFQSPNHSSRGTAVISLFVLHATVGDAISSLRHLINPAPTNGKTGKPDAGLAVSTHYLIAKTGKIYQLVDEDRAAWHAGAARWRNFTSAQIRDGSIGIELENRNTGKDPYPTPQIDALIALVRDLRTRYPIPFDHLVSHAQIAIPAGRKTDPKGFDFVGFLAALMGDPFAAWGPIGKPSGAATGFAVPRAWLVNKVLGACVAPETYSKSGKYSVTEFERGLILYFKARNTTIVEKF